MKRMYHTLLLLLALLIAGVSNLYAAEYWPTKGWRISTPEEQGMDSKYIVQMLELIKTRRLNIHSVLIIRNGYLVTEAYMAPYQREVKQNIDACTFGFTSALVGIAQSEGTIGDLDQIVVDFFPERSIARMDTRKKEITLRDLLTMTSGLSWNQSMPLFSKQHDLFQALKSKDLVQYVLDQPTASQPGVRFNYNSGAVHLLSAILQKATGVNESTYGQEHLFRPLGITDYTWPTDQNGITLGWNGLALTPTDMAKFGHLYLNKGLWEGKQVIPAKWVQESTKSYIGDFAYLWWQNPRFDGYGVNAFGGQYIFVVPKYNLVVVFTGGLSWDDYSLPQQWMAENIIPSIRSSQSISPNPLAASKLRTLIKDFQYQKSQPIKRLPDMAGRISGKTYVCEPNVTGMSEFRLVFQSGQCTMGIERNGNSIDIPVGLNGCYQSVKYDGSNQIFAKGYWTGPNKFLIDLQIPSEYGEVFRIALRFQADRVSINLKDNAAGFGLSFNGKVKE